jgi:hypothetical protein
VKRSIRKEGRLAFSILEWLTIWQISKERLT